MEPEAQLESESSEKSLCFSQEEEKEESQEPEETGIENPLVKPALTGDIEGLQKIFEDPENPHHKDAMQLLLEEDTIGRNLLYAACMAGQSDVIRALAKYGVNLNEKTARGYSLLHCAAAWGRLETLKALVELDVDIEALNFREEKARDVAARYSQTECVEFLDWADARLALKKYIAKVSLTITDSEKGPGRLLKEDKNTILNACRVKNEWLETHPEASINELFEQRQNLEDIVTPIFTKMATSQLHVAVGVILDIFGSIVCGYWCARVIEFILTDPFNNSLTNIVLSFSLVYMTFYIEYIYKFRAQGITTSVREAEDKQASRTSGTEGTLSLAYDSQSVQHNAPQVEYLGMSGIVALITVGLNLDSLSFKANMEHLITKFLMLFSSVYELLIYTFFGIVMGCGEIEYFNFHTLVFIFILFMTVNFARMITTILVSPILMHLRHEYNWRLGIVIAWSGIRGVYSILLAPDIYNLAEQKTEAPHMFIFFVQAVSLLTMGISSYMMTQSAETLGVCAISLPRQRVIQNVTHHIQQILQNTITLFKTEKLLTNVNWTLVEEKTKIEYIISPDTLQFSHILSASRDECPTDEILLEEAKLHVALIQMSSFEKQCNDGVIGVEAARILIGATKIYCLIQGKFISIYDVSTYIRTRSWLRMFKNILTYLEYHKERGTFVLPGSNRFILYVHHIVFSEEFEYAGYIITFMYIYPLIIHLWPMARELNVSALHSINDYFLFLYVLQSALKITILRKKYFQQHWNILDFIIMLIGLIDVFCLYFVTLRPSNLYLIQLTVVLGYLRIARLFPLFKIIIPVLIHVIDVQIKKHRSLVYTIIKGYVKSQEDAKVLVKQISGHESVYQKLHDILEKNKQDAVKELGLIEHENRDVVIALKTKQAVRRVFAKAQKRLTFLWSRGIMDRHEAISMNKVFLKKIKSLNSFPMVAPPPTPGQYLSNIIWLENKDVLIDFFKERAKLAYFDYGDVICKEGEMPLGIYLIISGMASLHSSSPTFGIDCTQQPDVGEETLFTEYCTSGEVLGELSCLLREEVKYTAICETTLQAFFISLEDLYEGFDVFWPSLEYKIWLNLALQVAYQYFEPNIADEDLDFQKCVMSKHAYVENLLIYNEMTLRPETMKFVIIVYGNVINSATEEPYIAPCIIPKTCEQIQGTADVSKLLIIQSSEANTDDRNNPLAITANLERFEKCREPYLDLGRERALRITHW
ncbi:Sodium/hydrogen exchanger 11 [Fukomys damarensis]|uniref:Sodium/hydrogen exchanger 11 n=1 Tax=Fukomys damarensis TaxID=885580 RepID=A0A091DDY8_FUKDA|nr:Sodium/hydrogen exchanger 11 [Fukomys damarensis]